MFHSRGDRDLGVAFQTHPGSQASSRGKQRTPLSSRVATRVSWSPLSGLKTLPTKVCLVKAMVFPVVNYGRESWTIKKAEHRRIDAFELFLEKTLESSLDSIPSRDSRGERSPLLPWRRGLTPRVSLECNPEIHVTPGV